MTFTTLSCGAFSGFFSFSAGLSPFRFCSALLFVLENRMFSHVFSFPFSLFRLFPSIFHFFRPLSSACSLSFSSVASFFHFQCPGILLSAFFFIPVQFSSYFVSISFHGVSHFMHRIFGWAVASLKSRAPAANNNHNGNTHYPPGRRGQYHCESFIVSVTLTFLSSHEIQCAAAHCYRRHALHIQNTLARITHGMDARKLDFSLAVWCDWSLWQVKDVSHTVCSSQIILHTSCTHATCTQS